MKKLAVSVAVAILYVAGTGIAQAERFQVVRKMVQLWSEPGDDMRPEIIGTVTAINATSVQLEGGAVVPVTGAKVKVGDLATFVCKEIGEGRNPTMRDCAFVRSQPADKPQPDKDGLIKLW